MLLVLADLAVATAAAGGLALLLTSLTFASHAWMASVPQRPAAGVRDLGGGEDPTGALFAFMLKAYLLALVVAHVHAWGDGPLASQQGQSAPAAPCPRVATAAPNTPTRLLGAALRAGEERPRHLNAEWSRGGALLPAQTVAELHACLQAAYALALLLEVRKYDQSLDWLLERSPDPLDFGFACVLLPCLCAPALALHGFGGAWLGFSSLG